MTWAPHAGQKIAKLYAWVAEESDGGEGVVAHFHPNLGNMPLVGADMARIESFRPLARHVAELSGCPVRLVEFSARTVLEDAP